MYEASRSRQDTSSSHLVCSVSLGSPSGEYRRSYSADLCPTKIRDASSRRSSCPMGLRSNARCAHTQIGSVLPEPPRGRECDAPRRARHRLRVHQHHERCDYVCHAEPFHDRENPALSSHALVRNAMMNLAGSAEGILVAFNPPSIQGLVITAGLEMQIQQRGDGTILELIGVSNTLVTEASQNQHLTSLRSAVRVTVPQLYTELNREKTRKMGVHVSDVFEPIQIYFCALYAKLSRTTVASGVCRRRRNRASEMTRTISVGSSYGTIWMVWFRCQA